MRTLSAHLLIEAKSAAAFPAPKLPEVAVVGRSNAGKSTLINSVVGIRHLARTAREPGKTRSLLFFEVDARFVLVDLPGYGFAKAPRHEQGSWRKLVGDYMEADRPLTGVLALFDIRRQPDGLDADLLELLRWRQVRWQAIYTKADKLTRREMGEQVRGLDRALGNSRPGLPFSSVSLLGREPILSLVEDWVGKGLAG